MTLGARASAQLGVAHAQRLGGRIDHKPDAIPSPELRGTPPARVTGARPGPLSRAVTPSGPTDKAQPAPARSFHRDITHCSDAPARVGHTMAQR